MNSGKSRPYSNRSGEVGGVARIWNLAIARKKSNPVMRIVTGNTEARALMRLTVTLLR